MRLRAAVVTLVLIYSTVAHSELLLNDNEIAATLAHGPWPPLLESDPSNRVSGNRVAIEFGRQLFFDPVLSQENNLSCASCHNPDLGFGDGAERAMGRVSLDRNTPSLWNVRFQRWFGWGGDTDNLWAQSLTPIINPDEMGHDVASLKAILLASDHASAYAGLFGDPTDQASELVLVNVAKSLAAYQETLVTHKTPFDEFRDNLARGDLTGAANYPEEAQRGLRLFLGRGNCTFCHSGPMFSNGEFHDAGVSYFTSDTGVDMGRFAGLQSLLRSPFTLDREYSDDPERSGAWAVRNVRQLHSDFGTFRVPSLRNVALTAPYMHDGSLTDLNAVARHYSNIDLERMHADGEAILAPLNLSNQEIDDLVSFLNTLSEAPDAEVKSQN